MAESIDEDIDWFTFTLSAFVWPLTLSFNLGVISAFSDVMSESCGVRAESGDVCVSGHVLDSHH